MRKLPLLACSLAAGWGLRNCRPIALAFLISIVSWPALQVQAQTIPTGTLVAQCIQNGGCWSSDSPTAWSFTLDATALAMAGRGATVPFVAVQTSVYVIRLGETRITFNTPRGVIVQSLSEFSGLFHEIACFFCEIDTVGTISIPGDATSATISGTFGNSAVPNSSGVDLYLGSGCPLPTGETTAFNGWDTAGGFDGSPNPTMGKWKQTLTSSSYANFSGATVKEANANAAVSGFDSCWFLGSAIAPFNAITGGTWPVGADNTWGDDFVGWRAIAVTYYRSKGRAPCGTTFLQQMTMMCPDGTFKNYGSVNTLKGSITTTTVTSGRAGGSATRRY